MLMFSELLWNKASDEITVHRVYGDSTHAITANDNMFK